MKPTVSFLVFLLVLTPCLKKSLCYEQKIFFNDFFDYFPKKFNAAISSDVNSAKA